MTTMTPMTQRETKLSDFLAEHAKKLGCVHLNEHPHLQPEIVCVANIMMALHQAIVLFGLRTPADRYRLEFDFARTVRWAVATYTEQRKSTATPPPNADALESLAQAVIDLADGMGGDEQEQDRAQAIAETLRQIAAGDRVGPIIPHDRARDEWLQVHGDDEEPAADERRVD